MKSMTEDYLWWVLHLYPEAKKIFFYPLGSISIDLYNLGESYDVIVRKHFLEFLSKEESNISRKYYFLLSPQNLSRIVNAIRPYHTDRWLFEPSVGFKHIKITESGPNES